MKRFNFNLEKVLRLRKFKEEQAKIELGQAIGVLSGIENDINNTALARSKASQQRFNTVNTETGASVHSYDPNNMFMWDNYINRLDFETEQLLKKAAEAELVVEEKRNIYLDASRELKVMEKLKEKREEEYRRQYQIQEAKELDEIKRVTR